MGEVITFTSGKGGTGKTTICAAVGTCLAADGYRVLCIDGDVGLRNLDISLGMAEELALSFTDVLAGRYRLDEATPHPEISGLQLLTAPVTERTEDIDHAAFGGMLLQARQRYDYCLIDAPAGLGKGFSLATDFADRIVMVSTPDPASMRDAAAAADQLTLGGKKNIRLVVNRITRRMFRQMGLTVDDLMDGAGLPLLGIVPEDANVVLSAAGNRPLILFTEHNAAVACLHIARRLEGKKASLLRL